MNRREYLATAGLLAGGVAGCSELDTTEDDSEADDEDTETGSEDGDGTGTVPQWAEWLPASAVEQGTDADAFGLDIGAADSTFPESRRGELNLSTLASELRVDLEDLEFMASLDRESGPEPTAITGSFSADELLETFGITESDTDEYRGYTVVTDDFAFGDGVIFTGREFRTLIDTREGETESIAGTQERWGTLLDAVNDGTMAAVSDGYLNDEEPAFDARRSGLTIDGDGDVYRVTAYVELESEDAAGTVLDDYREELEAAATEDQQSSTVRNVSQDGSLVVVEMEAETLGF